MKQLRISTTNNQNDALSAANKIKTSGEVFRKVNLWNCYRIESFLKCYPNSM